MYDDKLSDGRQTNRRMTQASQTLRNPPIISLRTVQPTLTRDLLALNTDWRQPWDKAPLEAHPINQHRPSRKIATANRGYHRSNTNDCPCLPSDERNKLSTTGDNASWCPLSPRQVVPLRCCRSISRSFLLRQVIPYHRKAQVSQA